MRCEVLDNLSHDQNLYKPGDEVELPTEVAAVLIENKIVKKLPPKAASTADKTPDKTADKKTAKAKAPAAEADATPEA